MLKILVCVSGVGFPIPSPCVLRIRTLVWEISSLPADFFVLLRIISVSKVLALQLGHLKFPFITSSLRPQRNCSNISFLFCFLMNASYLSNVLLQSLMKRCSSLFQNALVDVSCMFSYIFFHG